MLTFRYKLSLLVLALCLGNTNGQAAALRSMTTLHASTVRLSDLFDDAGTNADRVLGPGPGAGGRIVVEAPQLKAIARQFGVDWSPASSADRAVLDRPGRPLGRESVLDAVKTALIAAGASTDCDVELADFTPPIVPIESQPRAVVSDMDYDASAGRFAAILSITGDSMDPINLRLVGRADDTMELPVATARLPAGSVLRAEDVHIARVHTTLIHGEVAHRPNRCHRHAVEASACRRPAVRDQRDDATCDGAEGCRRDDRAEQSRHRTDCRGPGTGSRRDRRAHPTCSIRCRAR